MQHFTDGSLEVGDRNDEVMVATFVNRLRPGRLFCQLAEENSKFLRACLEKTHHFMVNRQTKKRSQTDLQKNMPN